MDESDITRGCVAEASKGDVKAVDALLERFLPGLRQFVRWRAGGVVNARESSSDLVQSVCREVLQHLADERLEYRGEAEFKKWLYQAALHKIQNRRRYYLADKRDSRREVATPPKSQSGGDEACFTNLTTPSRDAALNEEVAWAREIYERLPERYREIIALAEFEGRSHMEIAEQLGITEANSRVLLSRALARLATLGARSS